MKTTLVVAASLACVSSLSALSQAVVPASAAAPPSHFLSSTPKPARATVPADYGKLPLSFEANQGQSDPPAGSALIYSTYLGGSYTDLGKGIAVDLAGYAYAVGRAESTDFPVTPGAFQTTNRGAGNEGNLFVTKLNLDGSALVYSTFLGGHTNFVDDEEDADVAGGIAVDDAGHALVTGGTTDANFPTTPGAFQTAPTPLGTILLNPFVTEFNATGTALIYSTYISCATAGIGAVATGIALDSLGDAYVAGNTGGCTFPTTSGAFQQVPASTEVPPGFVTEVNPTGSALVYSTYLGGTSPGGIAVDTGGNAYVTGSTYAGYLPVTSGAFQTSTTETYGTAFVTKLNPAGSGLVYSTYLGGSGAPAGEGGAGIAVDASGNAYIGGATSSTNFPVTPDAYQSNNNGNGNNNGFNAFLTELNATGSGLIYSTYLGGNSNDFANAVAIDGSGNAYLAGQATSSNFPIIAGAFQTQNDYVTGIGFVSKFDLSATGPQPHLIQSITFDAIGAQTAGTQVALAATASSGLPVTFASTTPAVCTVSGDTATLLFSGYCNIKVTQAGNTKYFGAITGQVFVVHHGNQTITFPAIAPQAAPGSVTLAATASTGLPVTFASTTLTVCTVSGNTATLLIPGSCTIKASVAGNAEYWGDITGQIFAVQPTK